jgi:hypothetical protein
MSKSKSVPAVPARKMWSDLRAGKSQSIKDAITSASAGKPSTEKKS